MVETKKRSRLREFQANLAERLRVAATTPGSGRNKLGLRMGEKRWLIDLSEAGEILSVPSITPVPMTLSWFRGLVAVRGNLLSVVDLQEFMGQPSTQIDKDSRILAFNQRLQFNGALLVSRMLGLRNVAQMSPLADPPVQQPWVGHTYQDNEGEVWTELRLNQLIGDEVFLRVGRQLV